LELQGDITKQRRLEAFDKLMSLGTFIVALFFGVRALGMNVDSVLAIGGVGGVALGLAGREILENLFTGLIILTSNPFEVGDEVQFRPSTAQYVEGIVVDVGWYRTTIRSFEREIFTVPNAVFTRNVVLNITRKNKEWRFYEFLYLRLEDLPRVADVVSDARKILRQDGRIIQKLHRRVFLDKVTREHCSLYLSFYVEAANRDAFMAVKQDLLLAFIDCVQRNGAHLARNRVQLEMLASLPQNAGIVDVPILPQPVDISPASETTPGPENPAPVNPKGEEAATTVTSQQPVATDVTNKSPADSSVSNSTSKNRANNTTTTTTVSPGSIKNALSNSENGRNAINSAISPDAIMRGNQPGGTVLGSFDEDCL